jgi:hypothetical protein
MSSSSWRKAVLQTSKTPQKSYSCECVLLFAGDVRSPEQTELQRQPIEFFQLAHICVAAHTCPANKPAEQCCVQCCLILQYCVLCLKVVYVHQSRVDLNLSPYVFFQLAQSFAA